jgi:hypothetical protein
MTITPTQASEPGRFTTMLESAPTDRSDDLWVDGREVTAFDLSRTFAELR